MGAIERTNVVEGNTSEITNAGPPVNGTSEVQTITVTGSPTGGSIAYSYQGATTPPVAWNASAATVQAALVALPTIGAGNVVCGGGALPGTPVTVTFQAGLGVLNVPQLTANGALLTGGASPAVAVTTTTPGVTATGRGQSTGVLLQDTVNGIEYQNQGTALAPSWVKVGLET